MSPPELRVVRHARVTFMFEDASAARLGFTGATSMIVALARTEGTRSWRVLVATSPDNPLVARSLGVALDVRRVRYDEPRARALYERILRAIEHADLGALRRACPPADRTDAFFEWVFGLTSLEEALAIHRVDDETLAQEGGRDREEANEVLGRLLARAREPE